MASVAEVLKASIVPLRLAFLCADCSAISDRADFCPACASAHSMLCLATILNRPAVDGTNRLNEAIATLDAAIEDPAPFLLTPLLKKDVAKSSRGRYSAVMREYTYEQVVEELSNLVKQSSQVKAAASLGVTASLVNMVLAGARPMSADLALRLGFLKLPDKYIRTPKKRTRK
jgi:hypothetical protein